MENPIQKRKLILLVDDDPSLNEAIAGFLKESCFDVISETNPEKAVRLARHLVVDLVILDLQMPKLDGLQVLSLLREQQPHLKIIVLSGKLTQYEPKLRNIRADRLLSKPPDTDELLRAIGEITETIAYEPEFTEDLPKPKAKILIVDDDEEYCAIIADFLRAYPKAKFEVEYALSGLEGLEKAGFLEPEFVILDWKMPQMRGDEFYKKVSELDGWNPKQLFVVSGAPLSPEDKKSFPAGTIFSPKPFDLEEFCELVSKRCLDLGLTD